MSILGKLSTSLGKRDQEPNEILAKQIAESNNSDAINELVENLNNKKLQGDCIKVLYETGERKPQLIAPYDAEFIALLKSKNNRMIWGAMCALDCIASVNPKGIYNNLSIILAAADRGTVITKDHAVNILIKLAAIISYSETALALLLDQLKIAATNQLPKYAEDAILVIPDSYKKEFVKVLSSRIGDFEIETKLKRLEKVIKKLSK